VNDRQLHSCSLFDVFRLEVEAQVAVLNEGLLKLQQQPDSGHLVESLMQAVRAVKGAATIVELPVAVEITQALETCFTAAQQQTLTLGTVEISVLLQGVDILLNLSRQQDYQLDEWLVDQKHHITAFQDQVSKLIVSTEPLEQEITQIGTPSRQTNYSISNIPLATELSASIPLYAALEESFITTLESKNGSATGVETSISNGDSLSNPLAPVATTSSVSYRSIANELGDSSMLELFHLEVDAQAAILNEGLLTLESQPGSPQALESLMRAAHSVKGAARIVAIEPVVGLAHVMEDCFVAAQNHKVTLGAAQIDLLLQGVDLLLNISKVQPDRLAVWLTEQARGVEATQQAIAGILTPQAVVSALPRQLNGGLPVEVPIEVLVEVSTPTIATAPEGLPPASSTAVSQPSDPSPTLADAAAQDRVVRVNAENLNRIMGLAGESLIEANWLKPYADSLTVLKKRQSELSKLLEQLQHLLKPNGTEKGQDYLEAARRKEQECREILGDRLHELELFAQRTANLSDRLYREVIASHMRPFADGVQGFPRMVRDLARKLNKQVKLDIAGKATPVDRDILKKLEAPVTHILRNSVDHGIESIDDRLAAGKPAEGTVRLEAIHRGGMLAITISDDGRGIDVERLRQKIIQKNLATPEIAAQLGESELLEFLFLPGFSTAAQVTEISGRGVGLDIAKSMAQEVGGTVRVTSQWGKGTSFHFQLPLTLSVVRTLLVEISGEPYAFPLARIEQIVMVPKTEIASIEHRQYFTMDNKNIGLIAAHQVLELPESPKSHTLPVVVISDGSHAYGLVVDRFLGEHDLVVRPLDPRLGKVQDISAAALMGDGSPILIVDVADLVRSIDTLLNGCRLTQVSPNAKSNTTKTRKSVLVVDDSITVRETERKLLQNKGYHVDVAVDGMDGWQAICNNDYDLVVSDVDMPRMNGIELVSKIKSHTQFNAIPVIIVSYRDREVDRIRGLEVGADYYLTKASFHDDQLVNAVRDLLGA
jgi:two-component system sensor histidine kinase and response regulator WspE